MPFSMRTPTPLNLTQPWPQSFLADVHIDILSVIEAKQSLLSITAVWGAKDRARIISGRQRTHSWPLSVFALFYHSHKIATALWRKKERFLAAARVAIATEACQSSFSDCKGFRPLRKLYVAWCRKALWHLLSKEKYTELGRPTNTKTLACRALDMAS